MSDSYLEPPEPQDENVCTSCDHSECICDLPYEMARDAQLQMEIDDARDE
jgi:hypothetical protein